jgi:hypothetical protein
MQSVVTVDMIHELAPKHDAASAPDVRIIPIMIFFFIYENS